MFPDKDLKCIFKVPHVIYLVELVMQAVFKAVLFSIKTCFFSNIKGKKLTDENTLNYFELILILFNYN